MQNYRVQIDIDNYFTVDSKVIEFEKESIRIVNLRSIKGFIGQSFDLSDPKLKDIIHKYHRWSDNVELLNVYSRKFNHYNWFEIYSNQESSGINSNLKDSDGKLIPSKLYKVTNPKLPKFKKLNIESINFIPIWYVNGSLETNDNYCELFTTFEILIDILSKRFIWFESQLPMMESTFIQRAKYCGSSIEKYLDFKKEDLVKLLLEKDMLIADLNREVQKLNLEYLDLKTGRK